MNQYRVSNVRSSATLGVFKAASAELALADCMEDLGYTTPEEIAEAGGTDDLIVTQVPSYEEIAGNFRLWGEYMDPLGVMDEEEFSAKSIAEKEYLLAESFGEERFRVV